MRASNRCGRPPDGAELGGSGRLSHTPLPPPGATAAPLQGGIPKNRREAPAVRSGTCTTLHQLQFYWRKSKRTFFVF